MQPLLFIHGMFLNPKSWERWLKFFRARGYDCLAPAWPLHEGNPAELRAAMPSGLGELRLDAVIQHFATLAADLEQKPILIGHSIGGLIAQVLLARGLGSAAVCISSVAPNAMLSLEWSFLRNHATIINPLKGDSPCVLTPTEFHQSFCPTLTESEAWNAYETYVTPESRNVLRDSLGRAGHIDLDQPHPPMLFIAGEGDAVIPDQLSRRTAEAYTHRESVADFQDFPGRGHFICNEPGWQEPAAFVEGWLVAVVAGEAPIGFALR